MGWSEECDALVSQQECPKSEAQILQIGVEVFLEIKALLIEIRDINQGILNTQNGG